MVNELRKLIDVKSLVTLAMTAVVIYLAVIGSTEIKDIYLIIIAFYFGTQTQKKEDKLNEDSRYQKTDSANERNS